MLFLADTYQKVFGLDVSMDETFTVQVFYSTYALYCNKSQSFERESSLTKNMQRLQAWT